MTPRDEQIRMAIADQASEWFVESRGGPLDREARSRFMAWLQASPMHVGEYLAIAGLARDLDTAASTTEIPLEALLAEARVWPRAAAATLASVALATLWLTRNGERFGLAKTYATAHGEQSERVLPDGSVLHLNTDSQVTVHYSRREVEVRDQVGVPRPVDARAAVAWLKRRIVFENEPLGEVAEEFNRYGHIAIEIDDEALRSLPITGVFDAYDTDSFAAFLETLNGVVVQKTPTRIRVQSVASAKREQQSVDR